MSLLSLPDIAGMLVLMGVLDWLRRVYRDSRVDLWMLGLTFILIEAVASAVFRGSSVKSAWTHLLALDAYVLAGVTFGWSARRDLLPGTRHVPLFVVPAAPLLLLTTLYGMDILNGVPYSYVAGLSLVIGIGAILWLFRRSPRVRATLLPIHLAIWVPTLVLAMHAQIRWLIYWGLTCMYLLVAASFRGLARRDRIGGRVIVAGFVFWASCFFVHPLVRSIPPYDGMVDGLWNMQKFFVILGMLLVLLEEQTGLRRDEAMHDPLTTLPNRRLFDDRLAQALERSRRTGLSTALFALDLNGFKDINDTLGHVSGDMVLVQTADALRTKVRSSDTLARCGGDEFSVIVNDLARRADCERIAQSLREAVESIRLVTGANANLTISVGYALFPEDALESVSLCKVADAQMYEQKSRKQSMVTLA